MKKRANLFLVISLVLAVLIIIFLIITNQNSKTKNIPSNIGNSQINKNTTDSSSNEMVNCNAMNNPTCFISRMNNCLPVSAKLTGNDGTKIEIFIFGVENETCHFQRKINGNVDLNCYFPRGTMNSNTIDQTFGNDHGLQSLIDSSCKSGW